VSGVLSERSLYDGVLSDGVLSEWGFVLDPGFSRLFDLNFKNHWLGFLNLDVIDAFYNLAVI